MSKLEEFEKICQPVLEYLRKNYGENTEVTISPEGIAVKTIQMGMPLKKKAKDI